MSHAGPAPDDVERQLDGPPALGLLLDASKSSLPMARNVTALSQMEQSARVGGGCSQIVQWGGRR
jgi:hypothetical protein